MPFRFSLQAVLRCRESFEQRERQRLEAITREALKAQHQREQAKLERANALGQLQKKLRQGMTAVEMQFEQACDRARVRRIAACNDQVAKLEDLRRRQLEIFRQAQQQREILENLRDRQFAAYRLVQARRTQQEMDDRFVHHKAGRPGGEQIGFAADVVPPIQRFASGIAQSVGKPFPARHPSLLELPLLYVRHRPEKL